MKAHGVLALLSLGGAVISLAPAAGCNTLCTEVGCTTSITASLTVDEGIGVLEGSKARVCRAGDCVDSDIVFDGPTGACESVGNGDFWASCDVAADGFVSFRVDLMDQDADDQEEYSFTVKASDDAELGEVAGLVTYEKTEINGDGCGYCYSGSL